MARQPFRRFGTVVLGLILAGTIGAALPASAAVASATHSSATHSGISERRADQKWYQVQPSFQGQPEFLFEIAQRFLGDGNRATEIFNLNKGRPQPDGLTMTKPEAIAAGWILILPDDAKGDGVQTGPLPTASATTPAADPTSAAAADPAPSATDPTVAESSSDKGSLLPTVLLIVAGVLVLAAIVLTVFYLRRRNAGPGSAPAPVRMPGAAPVSPPPGGGMLRQRSKPVGGAPARTFDTAAAWTIDRALRVLVTGSETAGRPVPSVYGVSLDENRIVLRLAAPDGEPSDPWEAVENGRIWLASLRDLQALPASNNVLSPCPRLVTLGTAGGVRELVDLGQTTGVISVQGDAAAARDLVTAWAEELIRSPWTGGVRVVAGGLRASLGTAERLTSVDSVRDALTAAEGDQSPGSFALRGGLGAADGSGLGVLILGSAPGNRDMERVQGLLSRPDAAWVVVVLGQTRQDRWRFTIQSDGRLDTGALGITVYAGGVSAGR